jgi:hypothetical protein
MFAARRAPPIFPPRRPISAITRETAFDTGWRSGTGWGRGVSAASVSLLMEFMASWFMSGSGGLRIRLGMYQA